MTIYEQDGRTIFDTDNHKEVILLDRHERTIINDVINNVIIDLENCGLYEAKRFIENKYVKVSS